MNANWWTLLPLRGIASGKSRLAPLLDAGARVALNRQLLTRTLEAIEQWRGNLAQCLVISPCDTALELARNAGAQPLRDTGGGLNAALAEGAAEALRRGANKLLIVACDLPELSADALAALAQLAPDQGQVALAPDRAGSGTNVLAVDGVTADLFQFGADSCARHLAAFERRGFRCTLLRREELAFDLDLPQNYAEWVRRRDARIRRDDNNKHHKNVAEAGR
jgi:2-phospho-L-lactate guanylyltransferase